MQSGLELNEYRSLICESFLETHTPYDPDDIEWPDLESSTRAWLAALPVWDEAVNTEHETAIIVDAMARYERDPLMAEAIALQGYEESRHATIVRRLAEHYEFGVERRAVTRPSHPLWSFLISGSGECLDSFFAFGLFELARGLDFLPPLFIELFDTVMAEEARHIVFFENWCRYYRVSLPLDRSSWLWLKTALAAAWNVARRIVAAAQLASAGRGARLEVPPPECSDLRGPDRGRLPGHLPASEPGPAGLVRHSPRPARARAQDRPGHPAHARHRGERVGTAEASPHLTSRRTSVRVERVGNPH